jgi:hypothetical protein
LGNDVEALGVGEMIKREIKVVKREVLGTALRGIEHRASSRRFEGMSLALMKTPGGMILIDYLLVLLVVTT